MRRLAALMIVSALVAASLFNSASPSEAIDVQNSAAFNLTYDYDTFPPVPQNFRDRISNAVNEWDDSAPGSLTHNDSSTNEIGYGFLPSTTIAKAGDTNGCDGSDCYLHFNYMMHYCDKFYYGTGSSTGWSSPPDPSCGGSIQRYDAYGVLVHELGHWKALQHNLFGTCNGSVGLYSPLPDATMASMCYAPAVAGIVGRRTISQDEIQGVSYETWTHFVANPSFDDCPGCSGTGIPTYWMVHADSNRHWWGPGYIAINDGTSIPYPEVKQRVRGADADMDNDGEFVISAQVKAVADAGPNHRAVFFVRHVHGSTIDHEVKCPSQAESYLTPGQVTTVTCTVNLQNNSSVLEYEYGMRVTNKVVLYSMLVWDI